MDLGDVHPLQEVRVGGRRTACRRAWCRRRARGWPAPTSTACCASLGGAEGGDRQEAAGAGEPAPDVAAVAGVLRHRGHRLRLQGLEQDGPEASDVHRRVAVDPRDRAAGREPARPRRAVDAVAVLRPVAGRRPARRSRCSDRSRRFPTLPSLRAVRHATAATRRRCPASVSGSPRNSSTPASDRARASGSRAASHMAQVAVADVVELGHGQARGRRGRGPGRVRRRRGRRRTARAGGGGRPGRTRRPTIAISRLGSPGPALSKSMTNGRPAACRAGCRPTGRGGRSGRGRIGVRTCSTSSRAGSTSASRSAYGAPAPREALSTAFHSRCPTGASNHGWTAAVGHGWSTGAAAPPARRPPSGRGRCRARRGRPRSRPARAPRRSRR